MSAEIQKLLALYRQKLENISGEHIKKIILYGSYARGDFKINSDIDIMILVDVPEEQKRKYENSIYDITYDFNEEQNTEIIPIVQDINHFNYWKNVYMFYSNVEKEGVVI